VTPDEIRIAVAECCGWVRDDICDCWHLRGNKNLKAISPRFALIGDPSLYPLLPNYPASLDACAEFEEHLNDSEEWKQYASIIGRHDYRLLLKASAILKCEAFLRVKGKWRE